MESRVYWLFVICYVACILCRNALGESTKVFAPINDTSESNARIFKTENIRTVQSIETETRLDGITLKNDRSKFDISLVSPKNLSEIIKTSSDFLKTKCSRYCVQQVEKKTGKNNSVEDINLLLSFAGNKTEENKKLNIEILHDFLTDNSSNIKIIRHIFIDNKNSTNLDNCQVNLSEHTETNFHIDANITEIVINILGTLSRAVLTISTKENFNKILNEDIQSKANISKTKEFNNLIKNVPEIKNNETTIYAIVRNSELNRRPKFVRVFKRSAEIIDKKKKRNNDDEIMSNNFSDVLFPSVESTVAKNIINYSSFSSSNNTLTSYGGIKFPQSTSKNSQEQQQKIESRSFEITSLNEDTKDMKLSTKDNRMMQIQDNDQNFSMQDFAQNIGDSFEKRKILLEVNPKSNLIATPGTTHRILFDVTNNCVLPVRYVIRARSSPLRILSLNPIPLWLGSGQTNSVPVDIFVPLGTQDTVNTLTLLIDGTEIPEKTVYVYVQNAISKNVDYIKPTLEYSFNSNCAGKLDRDRCEKTFWSADIIVQDFESGLKRVLSTPNGLYLRTKFVSGTKDRITFYYLSNCCSTTATITAIDIADNEYSRTVDVTAWDNLSQGEIAAIVLGVLLLLFLIILLIIAIVYCVRRKSSHDLPYTQRYGSRQPTRSEGTSF
ncbi:uncharacterized protein [Anoplolepis gracilipes]|uniref:uncharacterized protein isoform X2 n=1 Tax=Anoplolepis gracilipes TaxID=354296 RepID=UPI003B9F5B0D